MTGYDGPRVQYRCIMLYMRSHFKASDENENTLRYYAVTYNVNIYSCNVQYNTLILCSTLQSRLERLSYYNTDKVQELDN